MAEREAAVLGVIAEPADQSEQSGQSGVHLHPADCDHPGRCPGCNLSGQVIKRGRVYAAKGKTGRYRCGRCGRTFVRRGGFEDMRKPDRAILRALNDFFKGHSPAAIADTLEGQGCRVHPATIYKWIAQFIRRAHAHLRTLPVRVGERFCADGVFGAASSRPCLFSVTDLVTRFRPAFEMATRKDGHNTTALLEDAQDRAGKVPAEFVSDGLASYGQAHRAVFAAQTPLDKCSVHVSEAAIHNKRRSNNAQERFNGTFGASQGPRRGIKSAGSRLIVGFFVHYNFVRPHTAIGGRTPAQAAGITIHGPDKRRTITGNAAWRRGRYREATWRGHPHGAAPRPGGARRPAPPRAIQGRRLGHAPPPTINAEESPPKNSYKYFNLGIVMSSLSCPECDADINIPADSVSGEIVACQDCGQSYELYESEGNFSLKIAETVGEDWGE